MVRKLVAFQRKVWLDQFLFRFLVSSAWLKNLFISLASTLCRPSSNSYSTIFNVSGFFDFSACKNCDQFPSLFFFLLPLCFANLFSSFFFSTFFGNE
jgi:hypothetical protein